MYNLKKITKITTQRRAGYYNIFLNEKYEFSVTEKVLADFMLAKDQELDDQQIAELKKASATDKAREKALGFLSYQPRSIKEVKDYLIKQDVEPNVVEEIIQSLLDNGYLDDHQFAQMFISNAIRVGSDGPKGVKSKLIQKGVAQQVIADQLEQVDEQEFLPVGQKLVKPLLKKAGRLSRREITTKAQQKLLTHGFYGELINQIIAEIEFDEDEDEDEALLKQGIKAYKKAKKYDGYERTQKMKNYLFTHGFNSDQISRFMNEEIISFDEIDKY